MDDIKQALEVELERLKNLVKKYRMESLLFDRSSHKNQDQKHSISHTENSEYKHSDVVLCHQCSQETEAQNRRYKSKPVVQFASVESSYFDDSPRSFAASLKPATKSRYFESYNDNNSSSLPTKSKNDMKDDRIKSWPTADSVLDLIERRKFQECFLHLHEFYRRNYPLDSELLIELRTLRGAYEHTGGQNPALIAALEKTLDEALSVEFERRLGIEKNDSVCDNYCISKTTLPLTKCDRDYRWQNAIRSYEIERADREFRLIQKELERMRTLQNPENKR